MVQSFSSLVGEYASIVNNYLDRIPVENSEQSSFEVVAEALRSLTDPLHNHDVPESLKDRITSIQECLDSPELYVQNREDDEEFKNIILRRVASKIQEFTHLNLQERERYVREQERRVEAAARNRILMASSRPPAQGSTGHVVSEEEWLRFEQERFQREGQRQAHTNDELIPGSLDERIQGATQDPMTGPPQPAPISEQERFRGQGQQQTQMDVGGRVAAFIAGRELRELQGRLGPESHLAAQTIETGEVEGLGRMLTRWLNERERQLAQTPFSEMTLSDVFDLQRLMGKF